MPTMTRSDPNLVNNGPLIEVQIAVPKVVEDAILIAGGTVPAPVSIQMMIDTGSAMTVIQDGLAARLGLSPIGLVTIGTASTAGVACPQYSCRLSFGPAIAANGKVIEAPMPMGGTVQGLIGRDILIFGTLIYIGSAGVYSLSF